MNLERPSSSDVSARMSRQASRDTTQEIAVRQLLHAKGLRFRVHYPVPGAPRRTIDVAFSKQKVAVFMDGCFWHSCPEHGTQPKNNSDWWRNKLHKNVIRDQDTTERLKTAGWRVLRFWEHEEPASVAARVAKAVRPPATRRT